MKEKPEIHQKVEGPQPPVIIEQDRELDEESLDEVTGGKPKTTFSSASNVLKIRHDTAKNSIANIR